MKSELPLFYYQPNNVDYLEKSLSLNKKIFKDILILKKTDYPEFNNVYQHMCHNHEQFERLCFLRFYAMLEYVNQNNIDKFLYCDSDAIFLKVLDFEKILDNEECVACRPEEQNKFDDITCAHFSIWTKDGLESFCNFITHTYTKNINIITPKWKWHLENQIGGGICDMTLMYHWYKGNKNLYKMKDGAFDRGIGMSRNTKEDEYEMKNNIKRLKMKDGKVYAYNNKGEEIEFFGLHFQGNTKHYMNLLS